MVTSRPFQVPVKPSIPRTSFTQIATDRVADRIYVGDTDGNLWRFDLSGSPGQWGQASKRVVLFAAGSSQPITGSPSLAMHPDSYKPWVFFGTGRYLGGNDPFDQGLHEPLAVPSGRRLL